MTSLSVVSSAAAAGDSIFNVLALGLANIFTGLFLICHNLHALITCRPYHQSANNHNDSTIVGEKDPYSILLGNVKNRVRHCAVVVVSFLCFGVIPLYLFYVLSIKGTDKGHYNAALVLSGTLVCVIALSLAKAYAFKMEKKLQTVLQYTAMAIGASALAFMATNQFRKNGFHELQCV
ncbi:membrane protein of ER body 1 [Eutrema salsugineum]|nr:membrane protein of ER body 1 [Eutrema salsugineum]